MAEIIATAEEIIKIGIYIHETIQDVKAFKSYADSLMDQIDHLTPSVQVLVGTQVGELSAAVKQEPPLRSITQSLFGMLELMKEVKVFTEDLKGVNFFRKITERGRIKRKYEQLSEKLEVLRGSVSFRILAEALKDIKSERFLEPVVKTLVRHARNFEAVQTSGKDMILLRRLKGHLDSKHINYDSRVLVTTKTYRDRTVHSTRDMDKIFKGSDILKYTNQ